MMKLNYVLNKKITLVTFFTIAYLLIYNISIAQLTPSSKVLLTFEKTVNEENVDGNDAVGMLESYIKGKTNLEVVSSLKESDYILELRLFEKNMGYRKGKIDIIDSKTHNVIFSTDWVSAGSNAFYGYSGSRHVIGKLVKDDLIDKFPKIKKKD